MPRVVLCAVVIALIAGSSHPAAAQQSGFGQTLGQSSFAQSGPLTWNFVQTADYVTNVALPTSLTPNARFDFSFIDPADPSDPFSGMPGNLITNGFSSDFTRTSAAAGASVSTAGIPLLPLNTLTVSTGGPITLPTGALGFLTGLIGSGGGTTGAISTTVTPAFRDDWRFQTAAGVNYQLPVGEFVSVSAGSNYYQALHSSLEQFDLQAPSGYGQVAMRLTDRMVLAVQYGFDYYFLEADSLASVNRGSSLMTFAISDVWFVQSGASYSDIVFRPVPGFNSANYVSKMESIVTMFTPGSYLLTGYSYGKSDAAVNSFSYDAHSFYTGARALINRTELQVLASLGLFDFKNGDPIQAGTVRYDKIATISAMAGYWLTDSMNFYGQYSFSNSNSNITRQDFDSSVVSMGVGIYR